MTRLWDKGVPLDARVLSGEGGKAVADRGEIGRR